MSRRQILGVAFLTIAAVTHHEDGVSARVPAAGAVADPHGNPSACQECHWAEPGSEDISPSAMASSCRRCHASVFSLQAHLDDHLPPVRVKRQMIGYFSQHEDFTCLTCHEPVCQSGDRHELRIRNPHLQLDERGDVVDRTCLYCHEETPDYRNPGKTTVKMRFRIPYLCSLCHMMESGKVGMCIGKKVPHDMLLHKKEFESRHGIRFPLAPGNIVTCTSCHNPHQEGLVIGDSPFSGPQGPARLLSNSPWTLCETCHGSGKGADLTPEN